MNRKLTRKAAIILSRIETTRKKTLPYMINMKSVEKNN